MHAKSLICKSANIWSSFKYNIPLQHFDLWHRFKARFKFFRPSPFYTALGKVSKEGKKTLKYRQIIISVFSLAMFVYCIATTLNIS